MKVPQKWMVAVVVIIGPALAIMDDTVVTVILSQIQKAFQTDFETITWTVTAYFLAQAVAMTVVGYVSDRLGAKLIYLASLALFIAGSLLCVLAPTKEALFIFRVLQGIGGGALAPLAFAIVYRIFPPNERGAVTAVISIPFLVAPALGPTLGGYLGTSFGWYAVFLINVPLGIVALLLSLWVLPGRRSDQSEQTQVDRKRFDILGLLLSLVGITVLVYGITDAGSSGWNDRVVLASILIGVAVLVGFVVVELRVSDPILDLRLFRNYTFTIANFLIWMTLGVFVGSLFLLPLFFESVRGEAALTSGEFLIGQFLALALGMTSAGVLYNRLGPRILTVVGLLLMIGGIYGLAQTDVNTTGEALQVWLLLRGFGLGLVSQPLQTLAVSVVSNEGMARASSLLNVTRQVVTAIAVAALTTYLTQQTAMYGVGQQAMAAGMADTFQVILILSVICIPLALVMGHDPAIEAQRQKQAKVPREEVQMTGKRHVISTLIANGEEMMGPELLLWRYPGDNIMVGSLLTVGSQHFCILKSRGAILKVYETGQYTVQTPDRPLVGSTQQAFYDGQSPWQYEVLYVNRAKLVVKINDFALSREMVEMTYRVDYSIHVATCENAVRLVQHMPYYGHTLNIQQVNAYAEPVIKQTVKRLVQATPVEQVNENIPDLSRHVQQQLQAFLPTYGITLDVLQVLVSPRSERVKALISLKAFGLNQSDALRYYLVMQEHSTEHYLEEQREKLEHDASATTENKSELQSTRANPSPHMQAYHAHPQQLERASGDDLQADAPHLDDGETDAPVTQGTQATGGIADEAIPVQPTHPRLRQVRLSRLNRDI